MKSADKNKCRSEQKMPTVLFLARSFGRGGAERQLVALVVDLKRQGWNVSVACFYAHGPLCAEIQEAGVPLFDLRKKGRWDLVGFFWRLIRLVRGERPDIIHGYLMIPNILALSLRLFSVDMKVVWGVRSSNMDLKQYHWLSRTTFRVQYMLSRFAHLIIVNSYAGLEYCVKSGFPRKKIIVIPNGIDSDRFRFDSESRTEIRRHWKVAQNSILVGHVARVDPMKDHRTFLAAAECLTKDSDRFRFVCVGDRTAALQDDIESGVFPGLLRSGIVLAGPRDDMPSVYSALDIVVSSSAFGEGFPNAIGEAMACDRRCVVTDVGDSARIVGDTGIVVVPADPESLAHGISNMERCLGRHTDRFDEACRERIVKEFSVSRMMKETAKAFRSLVSTENKQLTASRSR